MRGGGGLKTERGVRVVKRERRGGGFMREGGGEVPVRDKREEEEEEEGNLINPKRRERTFREGGGERFLRERGSKNKKTSKNKRPMTTALMTTAPILAVFVGLVSLRGVRAVGKRAGKESGRGGDVG